MITYKETIKKLFEAIDPEGQLQAVQDQMTAAVDAAVQAQVSDKEEQIKALESEIEQLKSAQAEYAAAQVEAPVVDAEVDPAQAQQVQELVDDLEQQSQQAFEKLEQQEQEIEELKQEIQQKTQKLQTLQKAIVQSVDAQVQQAKAQQQAEDEKIAIEQAEQLINAMDAKAAEEKEEIVESVSNFIDAFIDDKTQLNVAINATALAEAQAETFEKIRDILIEQKLFESGVKEKAEKMIAEAKETTNAQLNEAIAVSKKNAALEAEIAALRGEKYLTEKVKLLKPSIAEGLMEALQGKSVEQIDKEFDRIQQELEKNEEQRKQLLRQQAKLQQKKIDKELKQQEDITEPVKQSKQQKCVPTVQSAFGRLINVRKI